MMKQIMTSDVAKKTGDGNETDQCAELKEMSDVKIDPGLPYLEKVRAYARQIGNSYRYTDQGFVVELSFAGGSTFEERLAEYIKNRSKKSYEKIFR